MTERVGIQYDIQGAEQGAAEIQRLRQAVTETGASFESSSSEVEQFEAALQQTTQSTEAASQATQRMTRSTEQSSGAAREHTQQAIQFVQRIQAAATAVDGLARAFGGDGGAAGLIGRTAQSIASFAQLGSTLGPEGALVGGIVGALIPALQDLTTHQTTAEAAADAHRRALTRLSEAAAGAASMRVGLGGGTEHDRQVEVQTRLEERAAAQERIDHLQSLIDRAAHGEGYNPLLSGSIAYEMASGRGTLEGQIASLRERVAAADRAVGQLTGTEQDPTGMGSLSPPPTGSFTQRGMVPTSPGGAAPRGSRGGQGGGSDASEFARQVASDFEQAHAQTLDYLAELRGEVDRQFEEDTDNQRAEYEGEVEFALEKVHEVEEARHRARVREQAESQKAYRLEQQHAQEQARQAERAHQERMQREQEFVGMLQGAGQEIGGVFAGAFQSAVDGQETFDAAFVRGSKQMLAQLGERYIAEGAGALFEAIGFAFTNPPAAGAKAIEGAGKIALGASLGAASSAIHPPPAPGSAESKPESPHGDRGGGGGDHMPPPVVININAPSLVGGTRNEWGRDAARTIQTARRRWGQ